MRAAPAAMTSVSLEPARRSVQLSLDYMFRVRVCDERNIVGRAEESCTPEITLKL